MTHGKSLRRVATKHDFVQAAEILQLLDARITALPARNRQRVLNRREALVRTVIGAWWVRVGMS